MLTNVGTRPTRIVVLNADTSTYTRHVLTGIHLDVQTFLCATSLWEGSSHLYCYKLRTMGRGVKGRLEIPVIIRVGVDDVQLIEQHP